VGHAENCRAGIGDRAAVAGAGRAQVRRNDESKLREEQYANWHKFQDVMTPLFVSRYVDKVKAMEIRAETVVYNSGLSDDLFTKLTPAK